MSRQERRHGETQSSGKWKKWVWICLAVLIIAGFWYYSSNKGTGVDYSQYNYTDDVYASPNATTVIEEFSDFQCPYCQAFSPVIRAIRDANIGKVRVVYKEFPLRSVHEFAEGAAEAAECSRDQNRFWAYHDVLFESKLIDSRSLKLHAKGLGLNMQQWQQCMDTGKSNTAITQDLLEGQQRGVQGTPTLFVNGQLFQGRSIEEFQAAIK